MQTPARLAARFFTVSSQHSLQACVREAEAFPRYDVGAWKTKSML